MKMLGKRRGERGFTLIELLVVILIIAILASIAIPVFLNQRKKSYRSQVQSALKNAATAIESYITDPAAMLSDIDGADSLTNNAEYQLLTNNGYERPGDVQISVAVTANQYCITAEHQVLTDDPWAQGTYNSVSGNPVPNDTDLC